jgi:hypothetical protein
MSGFVDTTSVGLHPGDLSHIPALFLNQDRGDSHGRARSWEHGEEKVQTDSIRRVVTAAVVCCVCLAGHAVRGQQTGAPAKPAEPPELAMLRTGRPSERLKAAESLLFSRSMLWRILAMETLQKLPKPLAEPVLMKLLLAHPSPRVRMSALAVLSSYAGRGHLEILRIALRSEPYSGVRVLIGGLVADLERRPPPARGAKGQVTLKKRKKAKIRERARFSVTAGAAVAVPFFWGAYEAGAVARLGVRYKWFEFDLDLTVVKVYDNFALTDADLLVSVCPGFLFYSVRRKWLRVRHGFRIGFMAYKVDDPEADDDGKYKMLPAGYAHLVDIGFSPVKRLWFEISPLNLGWPGVYQIGFHIRYEI